MELTTGTIMLIGGIAGAVLYLILLLVTSVIFPRQRKKLLDHLQKE